MSHPRHAIILAAGASRRMGRSKAALPWLGGKMLLPWTVDILERSGWRTVVVVAPETAPFWRDHVGPDRLCINPHPEQGKITSLAAGLARVPDSAASLLVAAVDQPRPAAVYDRLAGEEHAGRILVPDQDGHRGHPVVIAASFREDLEESLTESTLGLRGFLDRRRTATVRVPFPGLRVDWDLNTPETYRQALAWFRAGEPAG